MLPIHHGEPHVSDHDSYTRAKLCPLVEGVEFWIDLGSSDSLHGVVTADVLRERFGAGDEPAAWIASYQLHRAEIHRVAYRLGLPRLDQIVILSPQVPWS
jgi:hypothetical protein